MSWCICQSQKDMDIVIKYSMHVIIEVDVIDMAE